MWEDMSKQKEIHQLNEEIRSLLHKESSVPGEDRLPAFQPEWLSQNPSVILSEDQILLKNAGSVFFISVWKPILAAAAVLLLAVGLYQFQDTGSGDGQASVQSPVSPVIAVKTEGISEFFPENSGKNPERIFFGNQFQSPVVIRTAANSTLELSVYPGTILRLRPETEIRILRNSTSPGGIPEAEIRLVSGEVLSLVNKAAVKGSFILHTRDTSIQVKGTSFLTGLHEDQITVGVAEGVVTVKNSNDILGNVEGGKELAVSAEGVPTVTEKPEISNQLQPEIETALSTEKTVAAPMRRALSEAPRIDEEKLQTEEMQSALEIISLKDGRELRGMVISQSGDRLLVQTAEGRIFINRSEISKIQYPEK